MNLRRSNVSYNELPDELRPCGLSTAEVEGYAKKVRTAVGFSSGDRVRDFVVRIGGRIHVSPNWIEDDGTIYVHGPRDFDIVLPQHTSSLRDQFTVSHELGHYFLHSRQGERPLIARRSLDIQERVEWEANWFAAGFLMPRDEFEAKALEFNNEAQRLAEHFEVSTHAAEVRLKVIDGH